MLKNYKIACLAIVLPLFINLQAQDWVRQYPFENISKLRDIYVHQEGFGWAVGENNTLRYTTDFGQSWVDQDLPSFASLYFVKYLEGSNGQKAISIGTKILRTEDAGNTWQNTSLTFGTGTLNGLEVPSEDAAYIITSAGLVIKSTDGGANWDSLSLPIKPHWLGISFIDDQRGWISSLDGDILKTTDGGANWEVLDTTSFEEPSRLRFVDENKGYLSAGKNFYTTEDGGTTWELISENATSNVLTDFEVVNDSTIIGTFNLRVYQSDDGGHTWYYYTPLQGGNHRGMHTLSDGQIWIAADFMTLAYSEDLGQNWEDQFPGNKNYLEFIDFYDSQLGIAGGSGAALLKTTNGGNDWEDISPTGMATWIIDGHFSSETEIWLCDENYVLHSMDGGVSWEVSHNLSIGGWFNEIKELDNGTLFVSHSGAGIFKSIDRGANWEQLLNERIFDIDVIDENFIIGIGRDGEIFKTIDGGMNWTMPSSNTSAAFGDIYFISATEGWIIAETFQDTIWHTTDAGDTWDKEVLPFRTYWSEMKFIDELNGWIAGGSSFAGRVLRTIDGGQTWEVDMVTGSAHSGIATVLDNGNKLVWVSGQGGNIQHYQEILDGINDLKTYPLSLFPNPSNGTFQIQGVQSNPTDNNLLQVIDFNGQILFQKHLGADQHEVNLRHLPQGIYIVQVLNKTGIYTELLVLQY